MHKQYKVLGVAIIKNSQPAAIPRLGADWGTIFSAVYFICSQTQNWDGRSHVHLNQVVAGVGGAPLLLLGHTGVCHLK